MRAPVFPAEITKSHFFSHQRNRADQRRIFLRPSCFDRSVIVSNHFRRVNDLDLVPIELVSLQFFFKTSSGPTR